MKQWVDADSEASNSKVGPKEGEYLRVWGRLKAFNNKRHIGAHSIKPVTDFNELSYHFLEATAVHLYFTKGMPGVKGEGGDDMFVDSRGGQNGGAQNGNLPGKKMSNKVGAVGRRVFDLLQNAPQNNEGLHVHHIASQLGIGVNDVFKAGDELLGEGLIYTTVDDETWAVLEY